MIYKDLLLMLNELYIERSSNSKMYKKVTDLLNKDVITDNLKEVQALYNTIKDKNGL